MEELITAWNEYLDWFSTQNDDPEIKADPVLNMPIALVKPTFENFIDWYSSDDKAKFTESVKSKEVDNKEYTKIPKEEPVVEEGPESLIS